jgi:small nuclear ribonucleoprotein G
MIVGTLRGFDQFMNLVIDNTVEVNGNEKNEIGMVVSSHILHFQLYIISS